MPDRLSSVLAVRKKRYNARGYPSGDDDTGKIWRPEQRRCGASVHPSA